MTNDEHNEDRKEQKANYNARKRVLALNDRLRKTGKGGRQLMTPGIAAMGAEALLALRQEIAAYDDFSAENDPHGEHDFGSLTFQGQQVFWKIDYYDPTLRCGSPDPADPTVTTRVLTIMLAQEY